MQFPNKFKNILVATAMFPSLLTRLEKKLTSFFKINVD